MMRKMTQDDAYKLLAAADLLFDEDDETLRRSIALRAEREGTQ